MAFHIEEEDLALLLGRQALQILSLNTENRNLQTRVNELASQVHAQEKNPEDTEAAS